MIRYLMSIADETDPMLEISMQSALHGMLIAVGELEPDSKVRGCDLPGIANAYIARVKPEILLEEAEVLRKLEPGEPDPRD